MTHKPTYASVTEEPCKCGYLQRAADDPDNPIRFDEQTAEFQFTYQEPDLAGPSMLVIYHCPFCGGAAPESKRELLFAAIPKAESERLSEVLAPVRTMEEALTLLGTPTLDDHSTVRHPERDGKPASMEYFRTIQYEQLSDVADVWITERADGTIHWQLHGKYIGRGTETQSENRGE